MDQPLAPVLSSEGPVWASESSCAHKQEPSVGESYCPSYLKGTRASWYDLATSLTINHTD